LDVDPQTLHVPATRPNGADPLKLTRQLSLYGVKIVGMPPLFVSRDGAGRLQIIDGVTRATRAAKWAPGQRIRVHMTEEYPTHDYSRFKTIAELLP
jgi:hypothetical protein